ncbi:hypothetical protein G347_00040 [Acinetobacter baumannii MSP4-16]|jgi:hypothetical protein|uniref:Uncharacterized protein n=7 Tax=Acinetobacter TaxID=469 RepID=A0ABX6C9X9_ACIB2|nr:hypothetical protein G347_00040 [Acinetobacter baumannii MSP4-16]QBK17977.1 hypothetical protein ASP1069_00003 [Acinetobacter seifertii]QFQ03465.1 hypothetical protein FQU82_p200011 [Acinetobacter baumannii]
MVFYQKDTIEGNMHSFSVKELDQLIENDLKEKKKSSKLLIGYKLFHDLMNDPKFHAEVTDSALSATKRKYKNLKIKITTDKYQLHFE